MSPTIPVFQLNALTERAGKPAAFFFLGPNSAPSHLPIKLPYRSNYYKIGICLRGSARLKVNLETYDIGPGSLMLLSPYVIKQWPHMSDDFEGLSIFLPRNLWRRAATCSWTRLLVSSATPNTFFRFPRRRPKTLWRCYISLSRNTMRRMLTGKKFCVASSIFCCTKIAPVYGAQHVSATAVQPRSQVIAADFKKLVNRYYVTERSLGFYADRLCITPKHLAETVKEATGKRAVEWLAEAVLLEAHVLLQNPALTIGQIADTLHFADQSTFGRFFRKGTGVAPAIYRQRWA